MRAVTKRWVMLSVLAVAVLCGSVRPVSAQTPQYAFAKVHYPNSIYTEISGINNSGLIVGTYVDVFGFPHAFKFDGTAYTTINYPGASYNYAFGVSASGTIVGSHAFTASLGPYHAFLLEGGAHLEFDYPEMETDARAINVAGDLVGIYNDGFGTPDHGFIRIGETYASVDYPGAVHTYAFGINDAGIVSGTYENVQGRLGGFVYVGGAYKPVAFPGATDTYVGGINNLNAMVGWSIQNGAISGFVLTGQKYRGLSVPFVGANSTKARQINDSGVVVGTYLSPDCPNGCGFVATPQPGGTPVCDQTAGMRYVDGVLNLDFTVSTSVVTRWTAFLQIQSTWHQLWALPVAIIDPTASFHVPFPLPRVGQVGLLSMFSTSAGTVCADFATVETGGGSLP